VTKSGQIFSLSFLVIGAFFLLQVTLPTLSYKVWEMKYLASDEILVSPQNGGSILGISIQKDQDFPALVSNLTRQSKANYSQFYVSVPSIGIEDAIVSVDSNNLNTSLAHLPGSALPGEKGNIFISGHSALPLFFKGDKNYGSIFAKLPEVKKGDNIKVNTPFGELNYQVLGIKIVEPSDLTVVNPPDSQGRFISLMTCVPPGFNTKRLVIIGKEI
jgi:LPXTG-site transpeptidase (sortase) family protein